MTADDSTTRKPGPSRPLRRAAARRAASHSAQVEAAPEMAAAGSESPVDRAAIDAIMAAEHGDPFAVLGPHQVGPGLWEVRAVLPEASAAFVEADGQVVEMERRHAAGFFVARIEGAFRPTYRLRIDTGSATYPPSLGQNSRCLPEPINIYAIAATAAEHYCPVISDEIELECPNT